jgi:hypothetical protein
VLDVTICAKERRNQNDEADHEAPFYIVFVFSRRYST